tara:strand:+ start:1069 stop:1305 length:237 start_codon:yes stop_codon:yes gene_type:complete
MRKWIVTTEEVHKADWAVFAESADDAKKKVDAGDGESVPQEDSFSHRLSMDKWGVRLYAPICSQRLPNPPKVRFHPSQ